MTQSSASATPLEAQYRPGYEVAAEQILEFIAVENLLPGQRLPTEKELAEQIGISRAMTRDAVRTLAALGQLSVRKGAGIFVAESTVTVSSDGLQLFLPTDIDQVYMLFEIRRTLEREASRLAALRASPIRMRAITTAVKQGFKAANAQDFEVFRSADDAFHRAIATASGNMFFETAIGSVNDLRQQVIALALLGKQSGSLLDAAKEHEAIAEAIAGGDVDGADRAMCQHIDTTREQFKREIDRHLFGKQSASSTSTDRTDGAA